MGLRSEIEVTTKKMVEIEESQARSLIANQDEAGRIAIARCMAVAQAAFGRMVTGEELTARIDIRSQEAAARTKISADKIAGAQRLEAAQAAVNRMLKAERLKTLEKEASARKEITAPEMRAWEEIISQKIIEQQEITAQLEATKLARSKKAAEIIAKKTFEIFKKEEANLFHKIEQLACQPSYTDAAKVSKKLQEDLIKIYKAFKEGETNPLEFQKNYNKAIDDAKPILKQCKGGNKIIHTLLNVANALFLVFTLGASYIVKNKFHIFSLPTVLENEINILQKTLSNI